MKFLNQLSLIINLSVFSWLFCKHQIFLLWGFCQVWLRPPQENLIPSMDKCFDVSCHSSMIQISHLILLTDISWLVKFGISSLKLNPNTLWKNQIFIYVSFVILYTLPWIYFPFFLSLNTSHHAYISIACYQSRDVFFPHFYFL